MISYPRDFIFARSLLLNPFHHFGPRADEGMVSAELLAQSRQVLIDPTAKVTQAYERAFPAILAYGRRLHPGILFEIAPECRSGSSRNGVHLALDSSRRAVPRIDCDHDS